jgi:chaperonin GroEL (HSP60 family)
LFSASEASEMIIRVDDIIKCAPRPRNRQWWLLYYYDY